MLYTTLEVAKKLNISKSTVQFYRQVGLIEPSGKKENGWLLYSNGAIEKLRTILDLRQRNLSVEEIKQKFRELRII